MAYGKRWRYGVKALIFKDRHRMVMETRPDPTPGPGEVVLDVIACGICGSDVEGYVGRPGMASRRVPPLILGHEFVGRVREGPSEWLGRTVAVYPFVTCETCGYCRQGMHHLCPQRELIGLHRPGALAERVAVPIRCLFPLPEGIAAWRGALAEPLAVAWHAVSLADPLLGRRVRVIGGGTIGFLTAWLARRAGANVQVVEIHPGRRAFLQQQGIPALERGHEPMDVVIDTVGGTETHRDAISGVKPGGTAVIVGLHDDETALSMYDVVLGERRIQGSYAYTLDDFRRALSLVKELPETFVTRWPLTRGAEAFAALAAGQAPSLKILLEPGHEG